MPKKNWKLINKEAFKKLAGHCYFCPCADYACLHVHRIIPGEDDGIYSTFNSLVVCANHHNLIHSDDPPIVIDRKYLCTNGKWLLHFWENGKECWM